jgi:hypothetical protein
MHKYCLDTSGLSNPLLDLPDDIHVSLWSKVVLKIEEGVFCWNEEINEELKSIYGSLGACLMNCSPKCCYEVGADTWDWEQYLQYVEVWRGTYRHVISEYNSSRKSTIGLNDLSIVAFAKTKGLPLVSMEKRNVGGPSQTKIKMPDLCDLVGVSHLSFNEFLRKEGISA